VENGSVLQALKPPVEDIKRKSDDQQEITCWSSLLPQLDIGQPWPCRIGMPHSLIPELSSLLHLDHNGCVGPQRF